MHSLVTTDAAQADINHVSDFLHGDERELYGDSAYHAAWLAETCRENGIKYRVNRRGSRSAAERRWNRARSPAPGAGRACVHVVKRLSGFTKVRYRGLAKNTTRLFTMFALANLYMVRKELCPT